MCQSVVVRVWGSGSLGPQDSTQDGSKWSKLAVHLRGDHDNDSQKFAAFFLRILAVRESADFLLIIKEIDQVLC